MAFDKAKVIQAAQKHVQKGNHEKAIREYEKLAKADPRDVSPRMKIAGLYAKLGNLAASVSAYQGAADIYSNKGFYNKAVAVYKQMLQVDPTYVDGHLKLADVLQKMGLLGDAMQQYKTVVAYYDKEGQTFKALETLKKMVDLDPSNLATHVKLAEIYYRQEMPQEGYQQLKTVIHDLSSQGRHDEAVSTLEKLLRLDPQNADGMREGYKLLMGLQRYDQALPIAQKYLRAEKDDLQAIEDVSVIFGALGNTKNQKIALKELAKRYQHNGDQGRAESFYKQVLQIEPQDATALAALGMNSPAQAPAQAAPPPPPPPQQPAAAAPPPSPTEEIIIEDEEPVMAPDEDMLIADEEATVDEVSAGGDMGEVLIDESESAGAQGGLGPLPGEHEQDHLSDHEVEEMLTESDVYVKYGLRPKAITHLKRVAMLRPDHVVAISRLASLMSEDGDDAGALETLMRAASANEATNNQAAAHSVYEVILTLDPQNEIARGKLGGGAAPAAAAPSLEEEIVIEEPAAPAAAAPSLEEEIIIEEPVAPAAAAPGLEEEIVVEAPAAPSLEEEISIDVSEPEAPAATSLEEEISFDIGEPEAPAASLEEEIAVEAPAAPSLEEEISFDIGEPEAPAAPAASLEEEISIEVPAPAAAAAPPSLEEEISVEVPAPPAAAMPSLEEEIAVEAPAAQAPIAPPAPEPAPPPSLEEEIAIETPAPVAAAPIAPPAPEPVAPAAPVAPPPTEPVAPAAEPVAPAAAVPPPAATPAPQPAAPVAAQGAEVVSMPGAPASVPAAAVPEPSPVDPFLEELDEAEFYMSQEIYDEAREIYERILAQQPGHPIAAAKLAEITAAEAQPEPEPVAPAAQAAAGGAGNDQVSFDDVFDAFKKGVEQNVAKEDSQTHYDLGLAYKEMGLLDDAIKEFVTALGGVGARKAACYQMMAVIHSEKGEFAEAAEALQRSLLVEGISTDEQCGLKFELGMALTNLQRKGEALTLFEEVEAVDPNYRDVGELIVELKGEGVTAAPVQGLAPASAPAAGAGGGRRVSYV